MSISDWILVIIAILAVLYWYGTREYNRFAQICVPYVKPIPYLGNMSPVILQKLSFPDFSKELYDKLTGYKFGGVFQFEKPVFLLKDPELIKMVTVKDFDHFIDHRSFTSEKVDPLFGRALFNLKGQRWRDMRATLSPAFTSSKMKAMFQLMTDCAAQMPAYLKNCIKDGYVPSDGCKIEKDGDMLIIEMKDFYTRYTNDVIATSAFGISVDSLKNPQNEFYLTGKSITNFSGFQAVVKFFAFMMFPKIAEALNIKLFSDKDANLLRHLVHDTMAIREKDGILRPDMIHLLMQAKKGTLSDGTTTEIKKPKRNWSDDDLTAQAVLFFLAGFDTASTLLCFMSHLLAVHHEAQTKLQNEIDEVLRENEGKINYDTLHKMKYLDMVISESLRLYPPAVILDRICAKAYTLPTEPEVEIKPGEVVWMPVYALHRDPQYFPDPEKFYPERFSDENKHNINPFIYMPFGSGPRNCIGNRFALMESKLAIVHLLAHFNLKVVAKTPNPIRIARKGLNMTIEGGFWLGLQQRKLQHL